MAWDAGALEYIGGTPIPPPTSCPKGQWLAEYFPTIDLSGPVERTACETDINHPWAAGSPVSVADHFSARWTGVFAFPGGDILFSVTADDGVRMWLDGTLILDKWIDQSATTFLVRQTVSAGDHNLKVEYYESGGNAVCQVSWSTVTIPIPPPFPTPQVTVVSKLPVVTHRRNKPTGKIDLTADKGVTVIVKAEQ